MPIRIESKREGGETYGNPTVGPAHHTAPVRVDISALAADEVDAHGYLKPGVVFTKAGLLVGAAQAAYGVVIEAHKVADGNAAADLAAATDHEVAVATIAQINRAVAEDNLGRAYTADEVAGIQAAASGLVLIE